LEARRQVIWPTQTAVMVGMWLLRLLVALALEF
jgi:hypothetical protein